MFSPASISKHPVHSMLIVFPVGLWIFSLVSTVIFLVAAFEPQIGGMVSNFFLDSDGDFFLVITWSLLFKKYPLFSLHILDPPWVRKTG